MSKQLSILVISYNTREETLECLRSVFDQNLSIDLEVIIVDNQSTDGSADAIQEEFGDQVTLIRSEENLGFAGGNNTAAGLATGEYLLLLNPDTVILDHGIDKLMDFAEKRPEAGIWGARTVFPDRSINPSYWKFMSVTSLALQALGISSLFRTNRFCNPESVSLWTKEEEDSVDWVTGCFLLIKRSFWNELNGFSPVYFMYGEETDLCLRAIKSGAHPRATTSATIIHLGGASEKIRVEASIRILRAKVQLIKDHFHPVKKPMGLMLFKAWPWTRVFAHLVLKSLGRKRSQLAAREWIEIVKRRKEWAHGYVH